MPVTLSEVAQRAGVSMKTVSRVVNNEGSVASETRKRVVAAITALGYVPNVWAQRLARGTSGLIGLLISDATPAYLMNVIHGVMDVGDRSGYSVNLHRINCPDEAHVDRVIGMAAQRLVDGLLLTPPCDNFPRLCAELKAMDFPFVQLTPHERCSGYAWVSASDERGSYEGALHLIQLGHRRIAYLQGNPQHQASWARLNGFRRALNEAGISVEEDLVKQGDWTFKSGLVLARSLLHRSSRPSAIMAGNDDMAAGVIQAAWELGLECPGRLSVIGFDDVLLASELTPPLTTILQPIYEIAQAAAGLLLESLIPRKPGEISLEIPTKLIVRHSTAPYVS